MVLGGLRARVYRRAGRTLGQLSEWLVARGRDDAAPDGGPRATRTDARGDASVRDALRDAERRDAER
ncbi:hypothetical protein L6R52_41190, partial [Myxococcota bacterium]|nr:hypothetical protein [Myxococcota bacterium]